MERYVSHQFSLPLDPVQRDATMSQIRHFYGEPDVHDNIATTGCGAGMLYYTATVFPRNIDWDAIVARAQKSDRGTEVAKKIGSFLSLLASNAMNDFGIIPGKNNGIDGLSSSDVMLIVSTVYRNSTLTSFYYDPTAGRECLYLLRENEGSVPVMVMVDFSTGKYAQPDLLLFDLDTGFWLTPNRGYLTCDWECWKLRGSLLSESVLRLHYPFAGFDGPDQKEDDDEEAIEPPVKRSRNT